MPLFMDAPVCLYMAEMTFPPFSFFLWLVKTLCALLPSSGLECDICSYLGTSGSANTENNKMLWKEMINTLYQK